MHHLDIYMCNEHINAEGICHSECSSDTIHLNSMPSCNELSHTQESFDFTTDTNPYIEFFNKHGYLPLPPNPEQFNQQNISVKKSKKLEEKELLRNGFNELRKKLNLGNATKEQVLYKSIEHIQNLCSELVQLTKEIEQIKSKTKTDH